MELRYDVRRAMRPARYPLDTLAKQRARNVEGAVQGLAQAIAGRERAEAQRQQRQAQQAAHEAQAARIVRAEREGLERGELTAADLACAHAWGLRAEAERVALKAEVDRAAATEQQARGTEGIARDQVAARRADAEVVEKDRARWTAEARKRALAKEEEAMAEAFRTKR